MRRPTPILGLICVAVMAGCANREGATEPVATEPVAALALDGPEMYATYCLTCHQADGSGVPNLQPRIVFSGYWEEDLETEMIRLTLFGFGLGGGGLHGSGDWANFMPGFEFLSDEEIAVLLTYCRSRFGEVEVPVTPETVARVRAEYARKPGS